MKIKIGAPYRIGHNLSDKNTKKIAQVLENSWKFKLAVKNIRDKYNIPHVGFDNKKNGQLLKARRLTDNPDFIDDVFELTLVLNPPLPRYWVFSLLYFVLENILRPPQYPEILIYPNKYSKPSNPEKPLGLFLLLNYLFIMVGENVSKKQLHDFIEEEWDELKEHLNKLPQNPSNAMERLDMGIKIIDMRDNNDMSFEEIAEQLSKEIPEADLKEYEALNENNVRQIYHRTKTKLAKINQ
ncbi:hypothetical protein A3A70_03040 [candidate division WWE3 bacterium RIFCSPLOWO2_01_FULL_42_11]|uniref:Uncharacterized protein n=2 Tax=Bacteria candidate phyla TaxID=1783234 RepID=A0A1F4VS38_UNCKA|nr:MAG: hypothetical protein A3A70_03040 [candidate division WWE3 bacterium RIFCSPLOWO2_01_FULL_42_11]OGG15302.1 MAG: hypothetical protein A2773_03135 [Candidatus Gottesmanbacteria bacterium RIFCSPHIGHO2_01_FULL_39_10]